MFKKGTPGFAIDYLNTFKGDHPGNVPVKFHQIHQVVKEKSDDQRWTQGNHEISLRAIIPRIVSCLVFDIMSHSTSKITFMVEEDPRILVGKLRQLKEFDTEWARTCSSDGKVISKRP